MVKKISATNFVLYCISIQSNYTFSLLKNAVTSNRDPESLTCDSNVTWECSLTLNLIDTQKKLIKFLNGSFFYITILDL